MNVLLRLAAIVVIFVIAMSPAAMCAIAQSSQKQLQALSLYAGTWSLDTFTAAQPNHSVTSIITTKCWRSHKFYVCTQRSGRAPATLIVYAENSSHNDLFAYFVNDDASHRTAGMELHLAEHVWTYSGKLKDASGHSVYYRNVNRIKSHDRIEFREEYSRDGAHWNLISRGKERRLA